MEIDIKRQIAALQKIYALYDAHARSLNTACEKYCATCCTCNITLTRVEARLILSEMDAPRISALRARIQSRLKDPRFIPKVTTNQMAEMCLSRKAPPEEAIDPAWGSCPLLTDGICSIYALRPFGCRCMLSTARCEPTGAAVIDEFTLSVNTLFLQFIEHLDPSGHTGNIADMLLYLTGQDLKEAADSGLIPNRPIPVLMIYPEHQEKIRPLLNKLSQIPI